MRDKWSKKNPPPTSGADYDAWDVYKEKEAKAEQEWLRQWPNDWSMLMDLLFRVESRARSNESGVGTVEDLDVVDQFVKVKQASPDGGSIWPPPETNIARIYVDAKVRLDQVPGLLKAAAQNIEKQEKYVTSQELLPEEFRAKRTDWREMTRRQIEEIRADYFLATDRLADARALIEQTLVTISAEHAALPGEQYTKSEWLRRLGTVDAQEGRVEEALTHYQVSLAAWDKESLGKPSAQMTLAPIKKYYLAHGGTEEKWPEWATAKMKGGEISNQRMPPTFVKALPEFSAKDLSGRRRQLGDLTGRPHL